MVGLNAPLIPDVQGDGAVQKGEVVQALKEDVELPKFDDEGCCDCCCLEEDDEDDDDDEEEGVLYIIPGLRKYMLTSTFSSCIFQARTWM